MSGLLSKEKFMEMILMLDKDGDGTVDKEEFRGAWALTKADELSAVTRSAEGKVTAVDMDEFNGKFGAEYDALWAKVDADNDGNLTAEELAKFYGFTWAEVSGNAAEMSDDQILETLKLQAALESVSAKPAAAADGPSAAPIRDPRDPTIKSVTGKLDGPQESAEPEVAFLQALQANEVADVREAVTMKLVNVRCEEMASGEMPLHKLARGDGKRPTTEEWNDKDNEARYEQHKKLFVDLLNLTKEQCEKGEAGADHFKTDVNHRDKKGKSPLAIAIEFNRRKIIMPLIKAGADPMLTNDQGWNILHSAVNADDVQLVKEIVACVASPARMKVLVEQTDKQGRTPLHIVAYKCNEEGGVVEYLISLVPKAVASKADAAGNTAGDLATKGGRRRSRDLIEAHAQQNAQ